MDELHQIEVLKTFNIGNSTFIKKGTTWWIHEIPDHEGMNNIRRFLFTPEKPTILSNGKYGKYQYDVALWWGYEAKRLWRKTTGLDRAIKRTQLKTYDI